jgi:hypothetical protein
MAFRRLPALLLASLFALLLAGAAPALAHDSGQSPGRPPAPGNEKILADFIKIAFEAEGGDHPAERRLVRWRVPVRIAVRGDAGGQAGGMAARHARQLAQLTGHDIALQEAESAPVRPNLPNFIVLFADQVIGDVLGRYRSVGRGFFKSDLEMDETVRASANGAVCYGIVRHDQAGIISALVVVPATAPRATLHQCIVEEMSQALGLFNDSDAARSSIFNDHSPYVDLTEQDQIMLRLLYDRRLTPGMTQVEATPILRKILAELRPGT